MTESVEHHFTSVKSTGILSYTCMYYLIFSDSIVMLLTEDLPVGSGVG